MQADETLGNGHQASVSRSCRVLLLFCSAVRTGDALFRGSFLLVTIAQGPNKGAPHDVKASRQGEGGHKC